MPVGEDQGDHRPLPGPAGTELQAAVVLGHDSVGDGQQAGSLLNLLSLSTLAHPPQIGLHLCEQLFTTYLDFVKTNYLVDRMIPA